MYTGFLFLESAFNFIILTSKFPLPKFKMEY